MLKFSIICGLLASIVWSTMPTVCRQHAGTSATALHNAEHNYDNGIDGSGSGNGGGGGISSKSNVNHIMALNVQNYMDTSARPCENFYQYVCGHWYQKHIDELDFGDTLGLLDFEVNKKLEHLIHKLGNATLMNTIDLRADYGETDAVSSTAENVQRGEDSDGSEAAIYRKVRTYYKSCKKVKPYNLKKYLQLVQPDYVNNWLVLSRGTGSSRTWNAEKFDWLAAIAKLRLYGLNGVFLKEDVLPRWDDSSSNSMYLDKPNLSETEPLSEGITIEILLDIGLVKRLANEIALEVYAFETQLHRLQTIEDDEGPKEMQLGYLQEYMPGIAWLDFFKQLKGPSTTLETTVIIQNIPYMRALFKLMERTAKETTCNYIMIKFLLFLKQQGPAEISKQECIASLRRVMPLAMSHIVGKYLYKDPTHNDEVVRQIFNNLKTKFHEMVNDNRLQLPRPIVQSLLQKIENMQIQIGNSPRYFSTNYLDTFYERAELDANNFYVNQLSLLRLNVEKNHENLDVSPVGDKQNLNGTNYHNDLLGSSSSPFYVKPKNLIIVPYGFLQMPVYHRHLHDLFKYSVLGFSIAHELMHGFDSSGIEYDSSGNIMGPSEEITANQRFMHGLRCMQNDIATGSRSLNEKLADYEGLRLAYYTFFNRNNRTEHNNDNNNNNNNSNHNRNINNNANQQNRRGKHNVAGALQNNPFLPQFTNKQVFFITFAQFFCGKVNPSVGQSAYLEHALDEMRVLQTLSNFEEFSREFQCERRDKMQLKHRCKLW